MSHLRLPKLCLSSGEAFGKSWCFEAKTTFESLLVVSRSEYMIPGEAFGKNWCFKAKTTFESWIVVSRSGYMRHRGAEAR